jgi:ubiquinol-cytochrome c reductase iron-sulfur subunit
LKSRWTSGGFLLLEALDLTLEHFDRRGLLLEPFIRRRSPEEIEAARAVALTDLMDAKSANSNKPDADASDANRTLDEAGEWLVMIGVCTHLGCVPIGDGAGEFGGWFCPCHGSHYDTAGRIRKGPAPRNLDVPVAAFEDESTIKLG